MPHMLPHIHTPSRAALRAALVPLHCGTSVLLPCTHWTTHQCTCPGRAEASVVAALLHDVLICNTLHLALQGGGLSGGGAAA